MEVHLYVRKSDRGLWRIAQRYADSRNDPFVHLLTVALRDYLHRQAGRPPAPQEEPTHAQS